MENIQPIQSSRRINLVLSKLCRELRKRGYDAQISSKSKTIKIVPHGTKVSLTQQMPSGWLATPLNKLTLSIATISYSTNIGTKTYPEPKVGYLHETFFNKTVTRITSFADQVKSKLDEADNAKDQLDTARRQLVPWRKKNSPYGDYSCADCSLKINGITVTPQTKPSLFHFSVTVPIEGDRITRILRAISNELPTEMIESAPEKK